MIRIAGTLCWFQAICNPPGHTVDAQDWHSRTNRAKGISQR